MLVTGEDDGLAKDKRGTMEDEGIVGVEIEESRLALLFTDGPELSTLLLLLCALFAIKLQLESK
jgi:hypothetical protein